ncbi:class I SAM-dependent methyltransferase [Asticcacaulis sp. 201]|uniref:class I SAM-dependent methyltransferase n=1 Tax=Asticcacaulis sp. 201 TaxID=3028787 RepID=UPI002916733E|nr:class I SAM-dependent methyltransferase [Asticcacaulis sp. 201]MDV6329726.1 class I SAM-dependent methyltransferase [Asticcacaulis sp. 201]
MTSQFSSVATEYAEARPTYPEALFDWLAQQCPSHDLTWDVGAGSGQASLALAERFTHVQATDVSAEQLAAMPAHPRITRHVGAMSGLDPASVDLVTVAQALHWFDLDAFYAEVRRVLKPDGVIAVWSYGIPRGDDAALTAAIDHLHNDIVGPYWTPERHHVENGYADLAFPFSQVPVPPFTLSASWTIGRLLGYFRSWSATARMTKATGANPIDAYAPVLQEVWGDPDRVRTISWPLMIKAGHMA